MSRVIKFRAYDKNKRKMKNVVELDFAYFKTLPKAPQGLISDIWLQDESYSSIPFKTPLMQYTGIKDVDNKEIYESDIIEITYASIGFEIKIKGIIEFEKGCFWFKGKEYLLELYKCYNIKVIGNIYNNPKLINQID